MPELRETLAAIDAATGCEWCEGPLGDSPSPDFCGAWCQRRWTERHAGATPPTAPTEITAAVHVDTDAVLKGLRGLNDDEAAMWLRRHLKDHITLRRIDPRRTR